MSASPNWRPMKAGDIAAVTAISDQVHGAFTEGADVYADRLTLYPAGCFVLEQDGHVRGYLITHPWMAADPPALNRLLGAMPAKADCYYLHDLAILPNMQGGGAGSAAMRHVVDAAREAGQNRILLMAVNGADSFWQRQGFADMSDRIALAKRASYGPDSFFMGLEI